MPSTEYANVYRPLHGRKGAAVQLKRWAHCNPLRRMRPPESDCKVSEVLNYL